MNPLFTVAIVSTIFGAAGGAALAYRQNFKSLEQWVKNCDKELVTENNTQYLVLKTQDFNLDDKATTNAGMAKINLCLDSNGININKEN